jgi:Sigma-70, region 4
MTDKNEQSLKTESIVKDILKTIDREREQEIVSRRFGLFDRKETLEQIGELLGITRERVRQLEKSVIIKLKAMGEEGKLPGLQSIEKSIISMLQTNGSVSRISQLTEQLTGSADRIQQARIAFLATLCPQLVIIDENDDYHQSLGLLSTHDEKTIKAQVAKLIEAIKGIGQPATIQEIIEQGGLQSAESAGALASTSKHLATLNGRWGLVKWPMVNPKNIRDKIYVILYENGKHMHFNEIADAIKASSFKRKDVTTQAIHNELIKDKRFVLIGRGIYALKEWGYKKGTVADIITEVLQKSGEPLHRDEIVKRVLKSRYVKETTILLNLQGKPQFKRVAKATYTLAE